MFVVIQIPIADHRGLLSAETYKISNPHWKALNYGVEFARYFGIAQIRKKGGDSAWSDESGYCSAHRAIRFGNSNIILKGENGYSFNVPFIFRRLFSDGGVVSRLEIGLRIIPRKGGNFAPLDAKNLNIILKQIVNLPVRVQESKNQKGCPIIKSVRDISRLYLKATTKRTAFLDKHFRSWWVVSGAPTMILEYSKNEVGNLPLKYKKIDNIDGINLATYTHLEDNLPFYMWFLRKDDEVDKDTLRRLRINLLHLHAEKECLRIVFENLTQEENERPSDALQWFLNESLKNFSAKKRFGLPQQEIAQAALDDYYFVNLDAKRNIEEKLEQARRTLKVRVDKFINDEKYAWNKQLVPQQIINIENIIVNSGVDPELTYNIENMTQQIHIFCEKLSNADQKAILTKTECAVEEVVKPGFSRERVVGFLNEVITLAAVQGCAQGVIAAVLAVISNLH